MHILSNKRPLFEVNQKAAYVGLYKKIGTREQNFIGKLYFLRFYVIVTSLIGSKPLIYLNFNMLLMGTRTIKL